MFFKKNTYKEYLNKAIAYSNTTIKFITSFGIVSGTITDIIIQKNCNIYILNNVTVNPLSDINQQLTYSYLEFSSSEIRAICS